MRTTRGIGGGPGNRFAPKIVGPVNMLSPHIWLYSIGIPTTPPTQLRLTPYPEDVVFETDSAGADITYKSASIGHSPRKTDTEGSVPTLNLTLQNITAEAQTLAYQHGGLVGQTVRIISVRKTDLPLGPPAFEGFFEILGERMKRERADWQIGQRSLTRERFPSRRMNRVYCLHKYGRTGCGYNTSRGGSLQTCTKREDGDNGCTAHGLDEVAASLPNNHPRRILLFRGIPRQSGIGVKA